MDAKPLIYDGEELLIPTFEIASNPTIRLNEIKHRFHFREDIKRIIEDPIFDIEDWIDESYWPEWEITFHDGEKTVIKAPSLEEARKMGYGNLKTTK